MENVNTYLQGITRAEWFSEMGQQEIVNRASNLQTQEDTRSFREIVENLVFQYSITKEVK